MLDSTIINAFLLSEHYRKAKLRSGKDKVRSAHRAFRETLVETLLQDPLLKVSKRGPYITKSTKLPDIRLTRPIEIHRPISGKRGVCVFCS